MIDDYDTVNIQTEHIDEWWLMGEYNKASPEKITYKLKIVDAGNIVKI